MSPIRIVLTGGGTGGHIFPLIAVKQALDKLTENYPSGVDVHYFGPASEYWQILANQGIAIHPIFGSKIRRYFDVANLIDVPKFLISLLQALWKMFALMPDVVFSKGGPGSVAVVLSAAFYRIPVIIHESDTVPSLTTIITAKYAERIGISFDKTLEYLSKYSNKIALTGNPVRSAFRENKYDAGTVKKELGFDPNILTLLFLGGSQGAKIINDFVLDHLPDLLNQFQIIHQTGPLNHKESLEKSKAALEALSPLLGSRYISFGLLDQGTGLGEEITRFMTAADIIVSRAGSGALFEIAALGKPSLLVPLDGAAYDHQRVNAYEYLKPGAAMVLEEDNFLPHVFMSDIKMLLGDPEKLGKMSAAALSFAKQDAADIIAGEIMRLADSRSPTISLRTNPNNS